LGYLPFAKPTAELLFQFFSDRYERASVALTSNLAFAQWTQIFGNEQMTAALLDRLVHRSHILMMEGESFRFRQSLLQHDPQAVKVGMTRRWLSFPVADGSLSPGHLQQGSASVLIATMSV
jgi:hypothetical protein